MNTEKIVCHKPTYHPKILEGIKILLLIISGLIFLFKSIFKLTPLHIGDRRGDADILHVLQCLTMEQLD